MTTWSGRDTGGHTGIRPLNVNWSLFGTGVELDTVPLSPSPMRLNTAFPLFSPFRMGVPLMISPLGNGDTCRSTLRSTTALPPPSSANSRAHLISWSEMASEPDEDCEQPRPLTGLFSGLSVVVSRIRLFSASWARLLHKIRKQSSLTFRLAGMRIAFRMVVAMSVCSASFKLSYLTLSSSSIVGNEVLC